MQRLEVSGAVRPLYRSLGVKGLKHSVIYIVTLSWCCGSMCCVLCESYTVQNEYGYGCALCNVQRETSVK
jgi:hypothetical protein